MDACPLFNQVFASGRPDHLLMIDIMLYRKFADGRPITCKFIGADSGFYLD